MYDISANKFVKFQIKIPSGCWKDSKNFRGLLYFAAPCTVVALFNNPRTKSKSDKVHERQPDTLS